MIRNNYEDTIYVIAEKLNSKLDEHLNLSNTTSEMSFDESLTRLAEVTLGFNRLLMKISEKNTMVKEFVSERNKH
ncbi:hypothetical protein [Lactococcus lactis]|uniref:hypothetical protein n=1 Tax=Lactococcus lactis TaxID=1358 RepID=UPI0015CF39A3|nr:hypothetical protein [Lactococcus lactis]